MQCLELFTSRRARAAETEDSNDNNVGSSSFSAIHQAAGRTVPGVAFLNTPVYDSPPYLIWAYLLEVYGKLRDLRKNPINFP